MTRDVLCKASAGLGGEQADASEVLTAPRSNLKGATTLYTLCGCVLACAMHRMSGMPCRLVLAIELNWLQQHW